MARRMVSIGDLVMDLILPARLPILPGQHQEPAYRRLEPGGAANLLFAARHMGVAISAAGAVGTDVFGRLLLEALCEQGIETSCVVALPGTTTTLVIALTDPESGEHVFLGHYGEGPEAPYPAGLDAAIAGAGLLFVLGYSLAERRVVPMALRAMETAHRSGVPVYLDVGPFMAQVPADTVRWAVARSSLLLMTEDEVPLVSEGRRGDDAYADLLCRGPATLIVKQGAAGCTIITAGGQEQIPGYHVRVVDTVGAGDCFAGALVAGRLSGLELRDAARLANAMGAAAVQKVGAGRNAPTCAEVLAVLHQAGEDIDFPC